MTAPTAPDETTPAAEQDRGTPTGWRGPIAPLNRWSGDGRMLLLPEGQEPSVRPLPLAFKAQLADAPGHDNSIVVGLITRAWVEGDMLWAEGPFDVEDVAARDWADKLGRGMAGWVSMDPSDVKIEEVLLDADGNEITEADFPDDPDAPEEAWPVVAELRERYVEWKLAGATLVSTPALEEARVEPVWDMEPVAAQAALTAAAQVHTGAMIALTPSRPDLFAVEGGDPQDEMHLTLAYLGEAIDWTPEQRTALLDALAGIVDSEPISAQAFGHAVLNPGTSEPATVYLIGNAPGLTQLQLAVMDVLDSTPGLPVPEQHPNFLPHVTAGYGLPVDALSYTGPVEFEVLRVSFAGDVIDTPIGGVDALAAAGQFTWSWEAFHTPEADTYTSLTVTDDGRVFGHLGERNVCHTGSPGTCITIPTSPSGYSKFHRKPIPTDRGPIEAGILTMDTTHAPVDPRLGLTAEAVDRHYAHTGHAAAMVRVTEGKIGPWISGQVAPWLDPHAVQRLGCSYVSGDWRGTNAANRDLRAILAVNVEGFPAKSKALAASGACGEALVAAGLPVDAPRRKARKLTVQPQVTEAQIRGAVRDFFAEVIEERDRDKRLSKVDRSMRAQRVAAATHRMGLVD